MTPKPIVIPAITCEEPADISPIIAAIFEVLIPKSAIPGPVTIFLTTPVLQRGILFAHHNMEPPGVLIGRVLLRKLAESGYSHITLADNILWKETASTGYRFVFDIQPKPVN
jgi:hypothetical protein